jgi:3D (Asp-Asp-Asp) domain-containing protein
MKPHVPVLILALTLTVGCTSQQHKPVAATSAAVTKRTVRTTAYTHTEPGGNVNAIGKRLKHGSLNSAAADWSRFPLGTKFRLLSTGEIFIIDDYGSALVGKNTIDLYKPSRRSMNRWGARYEEIQILEWGSPELSLEVLKPRARWPHIRPMIASLQKQT